MAEPIVDTVVDDTVVEPTVAPTVEPVVEPVVNAEEPVVEPVVKQTDKSDWTPVTAAEQIMDMKYGDHNVTVEIPVEVVNLAGEVGLDANAIATELYNSDDFTLSEVTLNSLYDSFGKFQVDTYLSSIKANNDSMASTHESNMASMKKEAEDAWSTTLEIMGGEDRWEDMSAYADKNLTKEALAEFNNVMESGTVNMQQLMIKDLYGKFSDAGAPIAPDILDLEDGTTTGAADGNDGPMTQEQYTKVIISGEYKKDPEKYDKLRRAGMKRGI